MTPISRYSSIAAVSFALIVQSPTIPTAAVSYHRDRCAFKDPCWPDSEKWQSFNMSIDGLLQRTYPPAAVCHDEMYDEEACNIAKASWADPWWRSNQTGAYQALLWENGPGQCYINASRSDPCDQGIVPYYSAEVENVEHIQKSVNFASDNSLFLVVKNTGHSHLGRSSGQGAFSIWTHKLKGREWHDSFAPKHAPKDFDAVPAVTLQAGEQWGDVCADASSRQKAIVGGAAKDVGAAGGYILGGGHSPLASLHGLAVDNLLEMTIVTADGKHRTINEYSDKDLFWAVRGGGGNAWGVVTSVTYHTHQEVSSAIVHVVNATALSEDAVVPLINGSMPVISELTDQGLVGYGIFMNGFMAIMTLFNGTSEQQEKSNQTLSKFNELSSIPNSEITAVTFPLPTFYDYYEQFVSDPGIASNAISASRLIPASTLRHDSYNFAKLAASHIEASPTFHFIGEVKSDNRDNTAVHDGWNDGRAVFSLGVDWEDDISYEEKEKLQEKLTAMGQEIADLAGSDAGTYINEANPNEPDWRNAFWGKKYNRLLKIKKEIDPGHLFTCNRCVGSEDDYWNFDEE